MENRRYKRWIKEEDDLLMKEVAKSPHNIREAIYSAADKLERSRCSCTCRYYAITSSKSKAVFVSVGQKNYLVNRKYVKKNQTKNLPVKSPVSKWKRILRVLFGRR